MSYWKYMWSSVGKITQINLHYELITQSGETILKLKESEVPEEIIYCYNGDFRDYETARKLRKKEEIKQKYDKIAEELLDKFQEKNRKQIADGYLDGGDYIVKCIWDIDVDTEYLTYEEFKKFNGEI